MINDLVCNKIYITLATPSQNLWLIEQYLEETKIFLSLNKWKPNLFQCVFTPGEYLTGQHLNL